MARPKTNPIDRKLSFQEENLCQIHLKNGFINSLNSYLTAGYKPKTGNAIAIACNKLNEPKIKKRLNELATLKQIKLTVTTETMTDHYFNLVFDCLKGFSPDYPTAKGCYDSICKINGINVADRQSESQEAKRLTESQRKALEVVARICIESKEIKSKMLGGDIALPESSSSIMGHPAQPVLGGTKENV